MNETENEMIKRLQSEVDGRYPICPYCKHIHQDAWEWEGYGVEDGHGEHECDACERRFQWICRVSIDFTSWPIEEGE